MRQNGQGEFVGGFLNKDLKDYIMLSFFTVQ